ncbi:MAG: hypothetical protein HQK54_13905, partial [Oligoflexales bacterium]|nr:hypothetical protein [Oligoflexales bacterium]
GYYSSFSVRNLAGRVIGAAIVKFNLRFLSLNTLSGKSIYLATPEGIVIRSSSPESELRLIWPKDKETIDKAIAEKQYPHVRRNPIFGKEIATNELRIDPAQILTRSDLNIKGLSVVIEHDPIEYYAGYIPFVLLTFLVLISFYFIAFVRRRKSEYLVLKKKDKAWLGMIMETVPSAVAVTDYPSLKIEEINEYGAEMIGLPRENLLGRSAEKYFPWLTKKEKAAFSESSYYGEKQLITEHGTKLPIIHKGKSVRHDDREYLLDCFYSLSDKKELETRVEDIQRKLDVSSRLAALGSIAAGIAHEFKTPLTIARINLEMLEDELKKYQSDKVKVYLNKQKSAVERMVGFINAMKIDYYADMVSSGDVDVHSIINDTIQLVRDIIIKDNIEIRTQLEARSHVIKANVGKIQQVFMNFFTNARDAIGSERKGGLITVKTYNENDRLHIVFSDNGIGMSKETQNRIFEPFFTTKDPGKGSGIGMSITHEIIDSFDGDINVLSYEGVGTTFTVSFPEKLAEKMKKAG